MPEGVKVYITLPPDLWHYSPFTKDGSRRTFLLTKALYGLRQSGVQWQRYLISILKQLGYTNLGHTCVMLKFDPTTKDLMIFAFYVDDGLLITTSRMIDFMLNEIKEHLNCHDLGDTKRFIGLSIVRNRAARSVHINQPERITELLEKNGFKPSNKQKVQKPVTTSYDPFSPEDSRECTEEEIKWFQASLGSLNYIATTCRPDLTYCCGLLGRVQNKPREQDVTAMKRALRFLNATRSKGLTLGGKPKESNRLILYTDASLNDCTKTNRSTSGIMLFYRGSLILWRSKRQSCITDSTSAAKTVAMSLGAREILPIRSLLRHMNMLPKHKSILFVDNVASGQFALRLWRRHKFLSLNPRRGMSRYGLNPDVSE